MIIIYSLYDDLKYDKNRQNKAFKVEKRSGKIYNV